MPKLKSGGDEVGNVIVGLGVFEGFGVFGGFGAFVGLVGFGVDGGLVGFGALMVVDVGLLQFFFGISQSLPFQPGGQEHFLWLPSRQLGLRHGRHFPPLRQGQLNH